MELTDEQMAALAFFRLGMTLRLEARAGAGKTTALRLMGESTARVGTLVAFNRKVIEDAARVLPRNVAASTMHSLAFRSVGRNYAHRLNGPRMRSMDIARMLRMDHLVTRYGTQTKVLQPGFLASLVIRSLKAFCQTGDDRPGVEHVPYLDGIDPPDSDGERTWTNNLAVRAHIAPALDRAWADLQDPAGSLPYTHAAYLKQFERGEAHIGGDFILVDECQPPGTMVATPAGERAIETLRVGERVLSYNQSAVRLNMGGNRVAGFSARPFDGSLVTMKASGRLSRYTPNHICIAKIGPAFYDRTIVYLMRRGDQFRVGTTSAHHGHRGNTAGIRGRLFEEQGDAAWVLACFEDKKDALMEEQFVTSAFGVPQVRFEGNRFGSAVHARVEAFWSRFGDNSAGGHAALAFYGRDAAFPLINRDRRYLLYTRATELRACNLLDGMLVLDAQRYADMGGRGRLPEAWVPAAVGREPYAGPVFSLDVDTTHTYVADGTLTHNCQDQSGVMLSILLRQEAQLVAVGDSEQQLYEWLGAHNALQKIPTEATAYLTRSWRFGPEIAAVANAVLAELGAVPLVEGCDVASSVERIAGEPDALLCRSNAEAVRRVLGYQRDGLKVHLVGSAGQQVVSFAEAAGQLQAGVGTTHPELACFDSWNAVRAYTEQDPSGGELALLVGLVEEFGVEVILSALEHMPGEEAAEVIVSTAHQSKGREWSRVRVASDFQMPEGRSAEEEWRLLYVSATRARHVLDVTECEPLATLLEEPSGPARLDVRASAAARSGPSSLLPHGRAHDRLHAPRRAAAGTQERQGSQRGAHRGVAGPLGRH